MPRSAPISPARLPLGSHTTRSPDETEALAERVAKCLRPGDRIALCGPLGSGKTTFVRGLARGLGVDPSGVHSPTFTRVHHYRGAATLVHVDLYRVESLEAYQELGLEAEEESDSIVVFEWGERLPAGTPHPGIRIDFELESENRRCLRLTRGESTGPDPGKR